MAPALTKSLNRLSQDTVIDLVLSWLEDHRASKPYLLNNRRLFEAEEEDYLHVPAESIEALRSIYLQFQKNGAEIRKQDIIDRIVDGDWRRGLSLSQHASIDFAYLEQNDSALRWSALRLVPLAREEDLAQEEEESHPSQKRRKLRHEDSNTIYPQVSAQTFLAALKAEISPLVKAHYHVHRMAAPYDLTVFRLYITPGAPFHPRSASVPRRAKDATDMGRVMYVALPDSCPYVYVSLSGTTGSAGRGKGARGSKGRVMSKVDMAMMKKIVLEAIPKALSRPQERWALESTKLTAKSLRSVCQLRGNQKPGTGGGAYSIFTAHTRASHSSPVDVQVQEREHDSESDSDLRRLIDQRFGDMAGEHYAALDRVHVTIKDLVQRDVEDGVDLAGTETGDIGLTFSGSDVFSGLRHLAEMGPAYVNLDNMPAWVTGEMGVSSLTG